MLYDIDLAAEERRYENACYEAYYGVDQWGNPVEEDYDAWYQAQCERYDV